MLRILLDAVAVLLGITLLIVVIGYSLPKQHLASRAISLQQKPADVFALISDFKAGPKWRADLEQVESLPDRHGHVRFREKMRQGAITMEVEESNPPRRMVTRIDDKGLPFGGRWIFEVSPTMEGCRLNITERGEVYNPVFRFVSKFIMGYNSTMDTYLKSVARKFGEGSLPVGGRPAEQ